MTPRSRPETAVRRAWWLAGLLVVLGGLFGMHGLVNHSAGVGMDSAMRATVDGAAGAVGLGDVLDPTHGVASASVAAAGETGGSGMDMGAVGMCVAVLGLGLIALLLRMSAGRPGPLRWLVARPVGVPGVRGRDLDPPSLIYLSILRC